MLDKYLYLIKYSQIIFANIQHCIDKYLMFSNIFVQIRIFVQHYRSVPESKYIKVYGIYLVQEFKQKLQFFPFSAQFQTMNIGTLGQPNVVTIQHQGRLI